MSQKYAIERIATALVMRIYVQYELGNLIHFLYNLLTTDTILEITSSTKLRYKNKQQSRVQRRGVKFIIYRLMVNFFYNLKMFNP